MTPTQAADIIGCTMQHVRDLCRHGKIRAKKVMIPGGFFYDISQKEAERYRDRPSNGSGWKRGKKRN